MQQRVRVSRITFGKQKHINFHYQKRYERRPFVVIINRVIIMCSLVLLLVNGRCFLQTLKTPSRCTFQFCYNHAKLKLVKNVACLIHRIGATVLIVSVNRIAQISCLYYLYFYQIIKVLKKMDKTITEYSMIYLNCRAAQIVTAINHIVSKHFLGCSS